MKKRPCNAMDDSKDAVVGQLTRKVGVLQKQCQDLMQQGEAKSQSITSLIAARDHLQSIVDNTAGIRAEESGAIRTIREAYLQEKEQMGRTIRVLELQVDKMTQENACMQNVCDCLGQLAQEALPQSVRDLVGSNQQKLSDAIAINRFKGTIAYELVTILAETARGSEMEVITQFVAKTCIEFSLVFFWTHPSGQCLGFESSNGAFKMSIPYKCTHGVNSAINLVDSALQQFANAPPCTYFKNVDQDLTTKQEAKRISTCILQLRNSISFVSAVARVIAAQN